MFSLRPGIRWAARQLPRWLRVRLADAAELRLAVALMEEAGYPVSRRERADIRREIQLHRAEIAAARRLQREQL